MRHKRRMYAGAHPCQACRHQRGTDRPGLSPSRPPQLRSVVTRAIASVCQTRRCRDSTVSSASKRRAGHYATSAVLMAPSSTAGRLSVTCSSTVTASPPAAACSCSHPTRVPSGRAVAFDEGAPLPPTTRLELRDVVYFGSGAVPAAALHPGEEGLKALLAISTAIHAVRDERQLHLQLLDLLFEALPASEGAILRLGANGELDIQAVRPLAIPNLVHLNAATVHRVIGEGVGMLSTATPNAKTAACRTMSASRVRRRLWRCPWRFRAARSARFI